MLKCLFSRYLSLSSNIENLILTKELLMAIMIESTKPTTVIIAPRPLVKTNDKKEDSLHSVFLSDCFYIHDFAMMRKSHIDLYFSIMCVV